MSTQLFYIGVVGFALGIFTRTLIVYGLPEIICGLLLCLVFALIWRRKNNTFSAPTLLLCIVFLFCFLLASIRIELMSHFSTPSSLEAEVGKEVSVEGVIVREVDVRENTQNLTVEVGDTLLLVRTDPYSTFSYGDTVSVKGTLALPETFETEFGRTFNYPKYLAVRGVSYVISFAEVTVVESGSGHWFVAKLLAFKQQLIFAIEELIPSPHSGLAKGLLLGVKQGLGESLEEAFRKTGITHIVVLSGYNMMLVATFTSFFLAFIFPKRIELVFGSVFIVIFACMVGLGASVVRASLMALLVLLARGTGRTYDAIRALCLVGVAMLMFNPLLLLYDVGFQLSFMATLGIILVTPYVEHFVSWVPERFDVRNLLATTLAVQVFVTPLLLYQIGQFSVVAVLVNLLVLPMVPIAMLATFCGAALSFLSPTLALPFGYLAYGALAYIVFIARTFAELPLSSMTVPPFPFFVVLLTYGALIFVLYRYRYLVLSSKNETEQNTLRGWTIVEESTLTTKRTVSRSDTVPLVSKEIPIFFR